MLLTCFNWFDILPFAFSDIDECVTNPCSQVCSNTPGSYSCSCHAGFRLVGTSQCEDYDECSAPVSPCDQICTNAIGSYKCSCNQGFLLNTTTRTTCYSKKTCLSNTILHDHNLKITLQSSMIYKPPPPSPPPYRHQ